MTTTTQNTINPKSLKLASSALLLALSQLSPSAFADDRTWNNTGTDFATGSNWGGTAPTDSLTADRAIFSAATTTIPSLAADRSILGIDFTAAAGGSTLTSAANVILTLGANGIDASGQLTLGTNTVSVANLKIGAAQTWTLFSNTSNTTSNPTTFSVSSNIDLNTQNLTVLANRNGAGGNVGVVNLSGNITGTSGGNGLILQGGSAFRNTLNLTGANTYNGLTTISNVTVTANSLANSGSTSALGQSGDIRLGSAATNSGVVLTFNNLTANGTTDRLVTTTSIAGSGVVINNNDADNTVAFTNAGSLDTSGSSGSNLLVILGGTNTGDNTFGQVINERLGAGVTNFTKGGVGKWVLTGNNTYTSVTTVSGGKPLINGDQSAATGAVSVASTATLGGSGTIGGATTIANGAFLAPGNSPGVLTFGSSLTLNNTSTTTLELAGSGGVAGTDFDKIVVTGAIIFNGTLNIVSFGGYDLNQTASYDLFDFGSSSGNFTNVSVAATALTNNSGNWTGSTVDGTVNYSFNQADGILSVSAIPEPSTCAALAGLGILGFAVYRRRTAS